MQLLDVMRKLNTETEISFLLSAYIETLPFYDFGGTLPIGVTTLPLAGVEDVRNRFEALLDIELCGGAVKAGERVHAIVREAAEIFGVALTRLHAIQSSVESATTRDVALGF
jgi:hypothetical protein